MFKSKRLITLAMLSICLCAQNASAMEKKEEQTQYPCLKQPAALSDKEFLWYVLDQTTVDKKIKNSDLLIYTNTVDNLCQKLLKTEGIDFVKTERNNLALPSFAVSKCHFSIGNIINRMVPIEGYKPRDKKQKDEAAERAHNYAEKMGLELAKLVEEIIASKEKNSKKTVMLKNQKSDDEKFNFDWKIDLSITGTPTGYQIICEGVLYDTNSVHVGKIALRCCLDKDCVVRSVRYMVMSVNEKCRQQGIGETLLSTSINLTKELSKKQPKDAIATSLHATPSNPKMLYVLINYYKSFGFVPSAFSPQDLDSSILNGDLVEKYKTVGEEIKQEDILVGPNLV